MNIVLVAEEDGGLLELVESFKSRFFTTDLEGLIVVKLIVKNKKLVKKGTLNQWTEDKMPWILSDIQQKQL
jgi:hypothetical protein